MSTISYPHSLNIKIITVLVVMKVIGIRNVLNSSHILKEINKWQ